MTLDSSSSSSSSADAPARNAFPARRSPQPSAESSRAEALPAQQPRPPIAPSGKPVRNAYVPPDFTANYTDLMLRSLARREARYLRYDRFSTLQRQVVIRASKTPHIRHVNCQDELARSYELLESFPAHPPQSPSPSKSQSLSQSPSPSPGDLDDAEQNERKDPLPIRLPGGRGCDAPLEEFLRLGELTAGEYADGEVKVEHGMFACSFSRK